MVISREYPFYHLHHFQCRYILGLNIFFTPQNIQNKDASAYYEQVCNICLTGTVLVRQVTRVEKWYLYILSWRSIKTCSPGRSIRTRLSVEVTCCENVCHVLVVGAHYNMHEMLITLRGAGLTVSRWKKVTLHAYNVQSMGKEFYTKGPQSWRDPALCQCQCLVFTKPFVRR